MSKAKSYEVAPCKTYTADGDITRCAESEAEFFGLYEIDADGFSNWIEDYPTRDAAEAALAEVQS